MSMERYAFRMKLNPGMKAEYVRRHDEIWPELVELLKDAGVSDYSIHLDEETNTLFGVLLRRGEASAGVGGVRGGRGIFGMRALRGIGPFGTGSGCCGSARSRLLTSRTSAGRRFRGSLARCAWSLRSGT